jgi:hypothetical protein
MRSVDLTFRGRAWSIPADRAFQVAERVEEIVTLSEIAAWGRAPKFTKLARVYGEMLRFAGCKVSDADVYAEMMAEMKAMAGSGDKDAAQDMMAVAAVRALFDVLMDGAPETRGDDAPKANPS